MSPAWYQLQSPRNIILFFDQQGIHSVFLTWHQLALQCIQAYPFSPGMLPSCRQGNHPCRQCNLIVLYPCAGGKIRTSVHSTIVVRLLSCYTGLSYPCKGAWRVSKSRPPESQPGALPLSYRQRDKYNHFSREVSIFHENNDSK